MARDSLISTDRYLPRPSTHSRSFGSHVSPHKPHSKLEHDLFRSICLGIKSFLVKLPSRSYELANARDELPEPTGQTTKVVLVTQ
jgi:hypothetical protein